MYETNTMTSSRVALIHAVSVAIDPIKEAFSELWPEAEVVNILDDSLGPDRAAARELSAHMSSRIFALGDYALNTRCEGILFTCSAFGDAIEDFARQAPVPVLKPNEAMFEDALSIGNNVGMLATFEPSVAGMEEEFHRQAEAKGQPGVIRTVVVGDAMAALKAGDSATHNRLLAEAAVQLANADLMILAHFSTARAFAAVSARSDKPVLTSPRSAVQALRKRCSEDSN